MLPLKKIVTLNSHIQLPALELHCGASSGESLVSAVLWKIWQVVASKVPAGPVGPWGPVGPAGPEGPAKRGK
jgi:hypothetical protein